MELLSEFMNRLPSSFLFHDLSTWPIWFMASFIGIIFLGLQILSFIVPLLFSVWPHIPIKGKHLDQLEFLDSFYILFNKCLIVMFVYHVIQVITFSEIIKFHDSEINIYNTVGSLIVFYIFYDLMYMTFHRILHWRSLYPWIHKHHHRQKAPSRGNLDAINVHPFEFVVGEYCHLVVIYFIPSHIYAVVFFILAGGIFASLNHTRYDVVIPYLYSVKVHDVHHRLPESNYAQYIMLWDWIFGSYRPYDYNGMKQYGTGTKDD